MSLNYVKVSHLTNKILNEYKYVIILIRHFSNE